MRGRNQRVRLWDAETGEERRQLDNAEPNRRGGGGFVLVVVGFSGPEVRTLTISPDGKSVAASAGSTVRVWEIATGKEVALADGHWRAPAAIVLSSDGKSAVSWGFDRVVRRWAAVTGKPLGAFPAPPRTTLAAFSPDGQTVALANADNTIRLHDTATGKERQQLKGPPNGIVARAFAPGGKVLASRGGDNTIRLHDVSNGTELRQILVTQPRPAGDGIVLVLGGGDRSSRGTGPGVAFSPDGNLIVTPLTAGGDPSGTLVIFDAASGKELRKIESPQPVASFAFSPDGRTLAVRGADRTVRVWDVLEARELTRLPGHAGRVETVAYAPDGKTLASGSGDTTVLVWDAAAARKGLTEPQAVRLSEEDLASLWTDLAGEDATRALQGVQKLTAGLAQTVTFLGEHLKPAARVDPEKIKGWIADLDSEKFAVRQEAVAGVLKVGEQAVPALKELLASAPPLETRKRAEDLVNRLTGGTLSTEQLRTVRAVESLERIGTPEARRLLQALGEGTPGTLTTREARAALDRLGR